MTHAGGEGGYWTLVALWWGMMAAMTIPATVPWLAALARMSRPAGGGAGLGRAVLPAFAAGDVIVWLAFSFGAAALQRAIGVHLAAGAAFQGALFAAAGVYQLTPTKAACLKRCRSPMSVLLARWPLGPAGALRLGVEHGAVCLGCCWALMLIGLGAGAAGWLWMAALTGLIAAEKLASPGPAVARWAGVALLGVAVVVWVGR